MTIQIRKATEDDIPFLWDMLYEALYVPPGKPRPPRETLQKSGVARCLTEWGRKGDLAFVAVNSGQNPVGAIWHRLFDESRKTYGFIDCETPILSMAVIPDYRGKGIGTLLLKKMIREAKKAGYRVLSLSVDPRNPALRLYERFGFEKVGIQGTSWSMRARL